MTFGGYIASDSITAAAKVNNDILKAIRALVRFRTRVITAPTSRPGRYASGVCSIT